MGRRESHTRRNFRVKERSRSRVQCELLCNYSIFELFSFESEPIASRFTADLALY